VPIPPETVAQAGPSGGACLNLTLMEGHRTPARKAHAGLSEAFCRGGRHCSEVAWGDPLLAKLPEPSASDPASLRLAGMRGLGIICALGPRPHTTIDRRCRANGRRGRCRGEYSLRVSLNGRLCCATGEWARASRLLGLVGWPLGRSAGLALRSVDRSSGTASPSEGLVVLAYGLGVTRLGGEDGAA